MRAGPIDERRESRAEWRRTWRSVPYSEQKRIRAALQRGGEVDDPALAPMAAEAAEHRLRGDDGYTVGRRRAAAANRALAGEPRYPAEQT